MKPLRMLAIVGVVVMLVPLGPATATTTELGRYIVALRQGVNLDATARDHADRYGVQADRFYRSVFRGYAAHVREDRVAQLRSDPSVLMVSRNRKYHAAVQETSTGVQRVEADVVPGTGDGVQVAVLDTGIDLQHPDLAGNILGGIYCPLDGEPSTGSFDDVDGHGTHVAGTIAALDDTEGVVGVAPKAKLWAVRVLNAVGDGDDMSLLCGLEFVFDRSPAFGGSIRVANLSLGASFPDGDDGNCGLDFGDILHLGICLVVDRGVTMVVAAGNTNDDIKDVVPAAYNEVITVTALSDWDGAPCGVGTDLSGGDFPDDTFAFFSNNASLASDRAHTIGAPGVNIRSTWRLEEFGGYAFSDGTSMASPHVAGAAARYIETHPGTSPATVLDVLLDTAEPEDVDFNGECSGGDSHTDPSGVHPEPVLRATDWTLVPDAVTPGVVRGNVWHLNNGFLGSADLVFGYGSPSDKVVAGDWNGDGIDTPGVVKGNVWYLNDDFDPNAEHIFAFGSASDRVIVGDWDKDGDDTPGVVKGNVWFVNNGFDPVAEKSFGFGSASDRIAVGDWNLDGFDTPAVVKSNNVWFLNQGYDPIAEASFGFGVASAVVLAGDWDGDGRDTVGIRLGKNWYLNLGFDALADIVFPYGNATDRPVVGDWDGENP
jgi:subtilisin